MSLSILPSLVDNSICLYRPKDEQRFIIRKFTDVFNVSRFTDQDIGNTLGEFVSLTTAIQFIEKGIL